MRVLIITKYFPPATSNLAQLLGELAEDLADEDQVEVVAARAEGNDQAPLVAGRSVRIVRSLPNSSVSLPIVGRLGAHVWFTFRGVATACKRTPPDLVLALNEPPTVAIVGAVASLRYQCPYVQICHDIYPDITLALGHRREGLVTRMWRRTNRYLEARARFIVVVGRDMVDRLASKGLPREKLRYVPTWSPRQALDADAIRQGRGHRGWNDKFVVMFAGAMTPAHNLGMIAQAASALADIPDLLIVFVGDGSSKPDLVRKTAELGLRNVSFVPRLPKSEAQQLMALADLHLITLVPGLWGCGVPSKMQGIMAAGRPFIASVDDASEPARIAQEAGCGFVVPAGSAMALAEAIRAARDAPLDEMGNRARAAFAAEFERSVVTGRMSAVLHDAAKRAA